MWVVRQQGSGFVVSRVVGTDSHGAAVLCGRILAPSIESARNLVPRGLYPHWPGHWHETVFSQMGVVEVWWDQPE